MIILLLEPLLGLGIVFVLLISRRNLQKPLFLFLCAAIKTFSDLCVCFPSVLPVESVGVSARADSQEVAVQQHM